VDILNCHCTCLTWRENRRHNRKSRTERCPHIEFVFYVREHPEQFPEH
jgi:hypothetical protein